MKKTPTRLYKNEQGLAAIAITVFIMIVLTLVVLAFSQVARREQRQAFDRQLSTQAFYAAESGINDTVDKIRTGVLTDMKKDRCDDDVPLPPAGNYLDDSGVIVFSCVLYDRSPETLEFSSLGAHGEVISLRTLGNNLTNLTFTWNDVDGGTDFDGCPNNPLDTFPREPDYPVTCDAGMLRLVIMPVNPSNLGRDNLINNSYTVFLRPTRPGTSVTPGTFQPYSAGSNTQGTVLAANCTNQGRCSATINGVPAAASMFLQMRAIYKNAALTVSGFDAANNSVQFTEAQIKVDSTGKANDVLKRLQVRVPLYERRYSPQFAVEAMNGICKRLGVYPAVGSNPARANNDDCGGIN